MKGAMAEPLAKTIKAPKNNSVRIMGSNQNFFLTLRKPHKSLAKFMVQLLDPLTWHSMSFPRANWARVETVLLSIRIRHVLPPDGSLPHHEHRIPALFPFLQLQGVGSP